MRSLFKKIRERGSVLWTNLSLPHRRS